MHDLVIRGATIVDGLGHDPLRADIAVTGGRIAAIGEIGVRRLTSHQAGLYGIRDRARIAVGACADLLLFDPAAVGISLPRRVSDLPAGATRTLRDPIGMHGVFVNGVRVFDEKEYTRLDQGPGQVLDRFPQARAVAAANAAQ